MKTYLPFILSLILVGKATSYTTDVEFTPSLTADNDLVFVWEYLKHLSTVNIHSQQVDYTATIKTTLEIDDSTFEPTGIKFNAGSNIAYDDVNLVVNGFYNSESPTFLPANTDGNGEEAVLFSFNTSANIDIVSTPSASLSPVDPTTGTLLINSDHRRTTNNGTQTWTITRASDSAVEFTNTSDLAAVPDPEDFAGTNTINLTQTGIDALKRTFQGVLTIDVEGSILPQLDTDGNQNYLVINNDVVTEATFNIPTDYGQWAIDNGLTTLETLTGPLPDEVNAAGIAYGLLYAFDLTPTTECLPVAITSEPTPKITITIPNTLRHDIVPEYSTNLSSWSDLGATYFDQGATSLDSGKLPSIVTLSFPTGEKGFIRLKSSL